MFKTHQPEIKLSPQPPTRKLFHKRLYLLSLFFFWVLRSAILTLLSFLVSFYVAFIIIRIRCCVTSPVSQFLFNFLDFSDLQVPWSALPTHPRPLKEMMRRCVCVCVCVCRMQDGGMKYSQKSIPSASGFPVKRNMLHFAQSDSRYYGIHQESRSSRGVGQAKYL